MLLSPGMLPAIREASAASDEQGWSAESITALAIVVVGWAIVWHLARRTPDWQLRFFALFAWVATSVPMIAAYAHRHFPRAAKPVQV